MADELDLAADREQKAREAALTLRKPPGPVACGACHFCGEPVGPGQRFCGAECRDDWQEEQRLRGR